VRTLSGSGSVPGLAMNTTGPLRPHALSGGLSATTTPTYTPRGMVAPLLVTSGTLTPRY